MEIVKPTRAKVEGLDMELQFYVSNDKETTGVSQAALARMCGISPSFLNGQDGLLARINNGLTKGHSYPESFELLKGQVYYDWLKGDASSSILANIVTCETATAVILYYAFKQPNPVAQKTAVAFMSLGMKNWIKKVCGVEETNLMELKDMVGQVLGKLDRLETELIDHQRVVHIYPNLEDWKNQTKLLPSSEESFTLMEYFTKKGFEPSPTVKHRICLRVAEAFKSLTGEKPPKRTITKRGEDGIKRVVNRVATYRIEHAPMIDSIIQESFNW